MNSAQTFIVRQQGYLVKKTAKIVGKSVNFVKVWEKRDKTEGFARKPVSGRPTKNSSKIPKRLKSVIEKKGGHSGISTNSMIMILVGVNNTLFLKIIQKNYVKKKIK